MRRCREQYLVHAYLPLIVLLWIMLLPVWLLYSALVVAAEALCICFICCSRANIIDAIYAVFLPYIFVLDMINQVWGCPCPCPCLPDHS